jgi:rod shape-determining protein MreD
VTAPVAIAFCLLVLPVQMQLTGFLAVAGIRPDLPGAAVYATGLALGPWAGGAAGLVVGLLTDRFSAGLIGPQLAAKLFIGVAGGVLAQRLLLNTPPARAGVSLLLFILQGVWMTMWLRGTGDGWRALYLTALPEACYTAGIVMAGLWLAGRRWRAGRRPDRLALFLDR